MRKIKTFKLFEKEDIDTWGLSKKYLFDHCNIQEVLDMLLRVAYEIIENPKSDFEEEEDGQLMLITNISFGGGNWASTQFDKNVLGKMSVGFEDLTWQFEEPVDNEFFERNHNGDIEMGMDIGVVYNVGGWDPTLLDEDTANAFGLISENLPEWNIDTVNSWDL